MSNNDHNKEIDKLSGVETTGHEWDGLKELNNPLPRWWVWVFLVCVIWSVGYFVLYPAWPVPGGATEGTLGYTQEKALKKSQAEIVERQMKYLSDFEKASFEEILQDPGLYAFAIAGGSAAFKDNCATCHGSGAEGGKGYPNLNDDNWLWGGKVSDIHQTLLYGIRADNDDTRYSIMPSFGKDQLLSREEINQVVDYVLAIGPDGDFAKAQTMAGFEIFQNQCSACHGEDGKGDRDFGAPNLRDAIWLYGGERADVFESVYNARAGMMPAWSNRLDENTIRQLAIYVHQLGGGEKAAVKDAMNQKKNDDQKHAAYVIDNELSSEPKASAGVMDALNKNIKLDKNQGYAQPKDIIINDDATHGLFNDQTDMDADKEQVSQDKDDNNNNKERSVE